MNVVVEESSEGLHHEHSQKTSPINRCDVTGCLGQLDLSPEYQGDPENCMRDVRN